MTETESPEAASPPDKLWALATWLLGHAGVDARRFVAQSFGNSTGRTDFAVLAGLAQYGAINQAALGRRLGINLGDLVAVLNRLEMQGAIVRKKDQVDRRRNTVEITPAGRVTLSALEAAATAAQDELLEPLSPSERHQLVALLQRLVEHHRDYRRAGDGTTPAGERP
ncbi:MarR family winged helix-turn-helix transcriptional regulator [Microbacterium protaetiae]|nr:MarR family winged helix-turn-helix transcriptional regulator [Microbacterium protaetiae]